MSEHNTLPSSVIRRFLRACGHEQGMIWTLGDAAQAARYEATACQFCRTVPRKMGRGRGSSR